MTVDVAGLIAFILLAVALIILLVARPRLTARAGGQALAFIALFVLPIVATLNGVNRQLTSAKTTEFCLSCHVMKPYGESLYRDDTEYLPAGHFQNHQIPKDQACYTCHTSYAMFGGTQAKLKGVQHMWVNYLGTIPDKPELYEPFSNRECLHCHEGARSYEENELHAEMPGELTSGEVSCLECHVSVHEIESIHGADKWRSKR